MRKTLTASLLCATNIWVMTPSNEPILPPSNNDTPQPKPFD